MGSGPGAAPGPGARAPPPGGVMPPSPQTDGWAPREGTPPRGRSKACSFLITVEHGDIAESGLKKQVGEFDEEKIAADPTVQRFRGIDRYIAATNTNNKKNAYDLYWKLAQGAGHAASVFGWS